jgi:hypothetical protein
MSRKAKITGAVLVTATVAVLSTAAVRQYHASQSLRAENAALQAQVQQQALEIARLQRVRAENQQLARVKVDLAELERLRQEQKELLRLRGEIGLLRQEKAELDRIKAARAASRSPLATRSGLMASSATREEVPMDPQRVAEHLHRISLPANNVSWSPGQAAGPPDTSAAGDLRSAWAAQSPDGGAEWLKLEYEQPMEIAQVRVRETYNPGAITAITALLENGSEVTLWQGEETRAEAPVEMEFNVPNGVVARTVTVHLDTAKVPGWNEIDAVELVGRDGSRQWAKTAVASSYFGEDRERRNPSMPPAAPPNP